MLLINLQNLHFCYNEAINQVFNFAAVKRYVSVFLLLVFLFSAANMHELLKTGILIDHFNETKKADHSVSFIHFLVMHYITDDSNANDDDRDMQLPFKSPYSFAANFAQVFLPCQDCSGPSSLPMNETVTLLPVQLHFPTGCNASVWRPPQA
jgi:hypothetical protein